MPEEAAAFARRAVAAVGPREPARARALLWACARLATFGMSVGLAPQTEVLLHPSVIERFVLAGTADMSQGSRRTARANVRFVAAAFARGVGPAPVPLVRHRAQAPYTGAEIDAYLGLAGAQPTVARRMRSTGLICAGAGAGLAGADLRRLRGSHVVSRHGATVVVVSGPRARVVPVLVRYAAGLAAAAAFAGQGWVIGGVDPDRRNVTTPLIDSLAGGADLGRLSTARLRATWLVAVADRIGLQAFMDAAGVGCTQRLGDLVATLASPPEPDAVARLGALG
jgi:hypothetical protein